MYNRIFYEMTEELRCKAVDLSRFKFYLSGYAWDKESVLQLFDWCRERSLAILGGTVHSLISPPERYTDYPGLWSTDQHLNEDWLLFVERSYNAATVYVQTFPYDEGKEVVFEPVITDSQEDAVRRLTVQILGADKDHWTKHLEIEQKIIMQMRELTNSLVRLREYISQYLQSELSFVELTAKVRAIPFHLESDESTTYAEKFRIDLVEYILGLIFSLSSQDLKTLQHESLKQALFILNGEEPFCGERMCL